MGRNGYVQRFRIEWIPTHFGKRRAILVCRSCAGGAIRLYGHYGNYACRFCHRPQYLSQKQKSASRKRLAAAKLSLKLGGWPDIHEPLPPKATWKHKKRYQRLRNQIQALEAQAKQTRFRKQIDIRAFAYHVPVMRSHWKPEDRAARQSQPRSQRSPTSDRRHFR